MDLFTLNIIVSLASAVVMTGALVYILTYVLSAFSTRSGSLSPKFVSISLLYFFGSSIILYLGVEWLTGLAHVRIGPNYPFYLNVGATALALNMILHFFCGFITVFLYLRGEISQGPTLRRILYRIRGRKRARSRQ